jgi:peptide/nickel transport system permease protein
MPGDPMQAMLAMMASSGKAMSGGYEIMQAYKIRFGLDKPLEVQFSLYLQNLFKGDLGLSIMSYPKSVTEVISWYLPWTIGLLLTTTLLAWAVGNILGAYTGWKGGGKVTTLLNSYSVVISQIPYYCTALVLVYVLAYLIPLFPMKGAFNIGTIQGFNLEFILDVLWHSFLPALSIMLVSVGEWMIRMRSLIVSILGEDYLLFARTKGLKENAIMTRYAVRNAMLPQVTGLALSLGFIVNGAMVTEVIFAYPGMGRLFQLSLGWRDYNIMQGIFLISTLAVLLGTFILDIIYPLLDPRVRTGKG